MMAPHLRDQAGTPVFLATTAIESCWDTSWKIVFLGEGCRRYSRAAAWSELNAEVLPDLWDDPQRRAEAYRFINDLYERTLPRLGSLLDEVHSESHGERYWRVVVGHWLYYYLSVLFDRYAHLVQALERFPAIRTVLLADECDVTPRDTLEFIRWTLADSYNLQLYSRILESLGKGHFPRVAIRQEVTPIGQSGRGGAAWLAGRLQSFVRGFLSALLARAGRGRVILHKSYFSRNVELHLAVRSKGAVIPSFLLDEDAPDVQTDPGLRERLVGLFPSGDQFETVLAKLLPRDIPHCFLEGYAAVTRSARRFPAGPRAIFSANSWLYEEAFKQWAGRCSEGGTLLLVSQHGGGYFGLGRYFPQEDYELSIADRYYTWGWRPAGPNHDRAVPLAATLLAGRKAMPPDNRKTGVLYVATAEPRYLLSLQNRIGQFVRYLEWQKRFLDAVPESSKRVLRARLYPEDYGWDIRERWHDHSPEVPIEDIARPFLDSMEDCRLYVCDHLGTTFYEAMAANRPSVLFFDAEVNPLRAEALPWFGALRSSGILHDTPESAAQAVAAAYPDVEAWWNDPKRQAARRKICERLARTTSDPVRDWLDELNRVAALSPIGGRL